MKKPILAIFDSVDWKPQDKPADLRPGELWATHTGKLNIAGVELDCAVLSDGTRIFTEESIVRWLCGADLKGGAR